MILYHGSNVIIEKPDLSFSRDKTDFGKSFYLTPLKEQAMLWAERFKYEGSRGIVSSYRFLENINEKLPDTIRILEFDTHSLEWLSFITDCRLERTMHDECDIVIGGVANDKVIQTLQLYFRDVISAEDAIGRLRYNKPNYQYCFKNQHIIDEYLHFIDAEEIG
jgi:hypothetical protein